MYVSFPVGESAPKVPTNDQIGEAVLVAAFAAFLWPASAVAGALWLAVRRMTREAFTGGAGVDQFPPRSD